MGSLLSKLNLSVGDKVICTSSEGFSWYTVGKEYTILDGCQIELDDGAVSPIYGREALFEKVEVDLTTLDKEFGELDNSTKKALVDAYLDGETLQYYSLWTGWSVSYVEPFFSKGTKYRVKPAPTKTELLEEKIEKLEDELNPDCW